ncbi:MAG: hypothetical protein HQK54_18530 [Oligoflexales bacterium]|nr:hypothetical protein [Oligoflexales bacterium]
MKKIFVNIGYKTISILLFMNMGCSDSSSVNKNEAPDQHRRQDRSSFNLTADSSSTDETIASLKNNMEWARCVFETVQRLGINKYPVSDPELFMDILQHDMYLADLPSVVSLLEDKLEKPVLLLPMINHVAFSVVTKHPIVSEFLCKALDRNLIPKIQGNNPALKRMVHHTYLLEALTQEMARSPQFTFEVENHLLTKREAFGIRSDFMGGVLDMYHLTGNLFEPIKTKTMDWVFAEYDKIRERGSITPEEIQARKSGTTFNILEAAIAENKKGYYLNAMTGIAMAINPPENLAVVGDNRFIDYIVSRQWVSLYETWNLAFLTGNMAHLDILYPKLLIPSVIDAAPEKYLFNRATSLWVSINIYLLASLTQKPSFEVENREELTQLWSEINYRHASEYVLSRNKVPLDRFSYYLGMTYDMLWAQLKQLLIASGVITVDEANLLSNIFAGK